MFNYSKKEKLFPTVIEYQPYAICNANCVYCPVGMLNREQRQKGSSIREDVFQKMIQDTKGKKIERVSPHLNCEPLLCKNLPIKAQKKMLKQANIKATAKVHNEWLIKFCPLST